MGWARATCVQLLEASRVQVCRARTVTLLPLCALVSLSGGGQQPSPEGWALPRAPHGAGLTCVSVLQSMESLYGPGSEGTPPSLDDCDAGKPPPSGRQAFEGWAIAEVGPG